jgi:hypothetical protein
MLYSLVLLGALIGGAPSSNEIAYQQFVKISTTISISKLKDEQEHLNIKLITIYNTYNTHKTIQSGMGKTVKSYR